MSKTPFAKGNQLFREKKLEAAIQEYKKSLKQKETYFAYENMGMVFERLNKASEAEGAYSRAIRLNPRSVRAAHYLKNKNKSESSSCKEKKSKKAVSAGGVSHQVRPAVDVVAGKLKPEFENLPEELKVLYARRCPFEGELKTSYRESALSTEADSFVLYRIIGNDLYPRHAKGQSRQNVRFILENEPELADCEKRWVLNRIFDAGERQAIIELLEQHDQPYLEIPFEAEAFAQVGWDYSAYPEPGFLSSATFHKLGTLQQERVFTAAYRKKNLYLMNNNGARNAALEDGLGRAKWVLPWDGNCFVTASAWESIRSAVCTAPHLPYFAVPMERITDNAELLRDDFTPSPVEEPQLLFRRDARERFGENHPYGRRPKVELFWRLGIPGKWDRWKDDPWEQPRAALSPDASAWGVAGWVARLASGKAHLEASTTESFKNRGRERQKAIRAAINHVTRQVSAQPDPIGLTCYRFEAIEALRAEYREQAESGTQAGLQRTLLQNAAEALERQPGSPVDKPEPGPSGDLQDYYHPAPYWWPNPDTSDGLPYVRRDGERVPGTRMYEQESDRYDRTRLQRLFDDTTTLALAAYVTGDQRYATHAVRWLERWFIAPKTCMKPNMSYAQVRWGRNGNRGAQSGVIEMKDLYYALDAVRLLHHIGALSSDQLERLRAWFREYLDWLLSSKQGTKEAQARNNHGTYYDLQVAAIAAFLDDHDTLYATLARAEERIPLQISSEGVQHEEMARSLTAHYCCFTLMGWLNLLNLATRFDGTFVSRAAEPDHPLRKAVEWLLAHEGSPWPYPQIDEFDHRRFLPIKSHGRSLGLFSTEAKHDEFVAPACFAPHDGIQIFWLLSVAGRRDKNSANLSLLHVVVMRFGVGVFDELWLRHRFGLLSSITVPSLKKQEWRESMHFLVQVDERISKEWLDRLRDLLFGLPFFIQKLQLHSDRGVGLRRYCKEKVYNLSYTHVLTTRIDDDDAISICSLNEINLTAKNLMTSGVSSCTIALRSTTRFIPEVNIAKDFFVKEPDAIGLSLLQDSQSETNIYNGGHKGLMKRYGHGVWLDRSKARALYTIHRMSDSNYENRVSDMLVDESKYEISSQDLDAFGVDSEMLKKWIDLDKALPVLGGYKTLDYISMWRKKLLKSGKD